MRIPSRGRGRVSVGTSVICALGVFLTGASATAQQRPVGRGAQRPAAAAAATSAQPQISVAGIRVIGPGLGKNGTELQPFHESPGTFVALAILPPKGSGIVAVDDDASKLDAFADDKGQNLLEEGRIGPFPKVAEDGSAALVDLEVHARPSAGTSSITVQGTIALTLSAGSKPTRVSAVRLAADTTFKVGATTMTINQAKASDDSTDITFGLPRSVLQMLRDVRFFDTKNAPLEASRAGSGYMNQKAELEYRVKTTDKAVTIEFELWQNPRTIKAPFNVQAGLGSVPAGRASESGGAPTASASQAPKPAAAAPKVEGPPPAIGASDGAASVDAVVKQMQTAAVAGKGAQVLSVIYPTDRPTYGQGVAMALALSPMGSMGNEKAGEQMQKELDALFAKHQVKPPFSRDAADLFKGVDLPAFISDAFAFMKSHAKKGDKPEDTYPILWGKPENVQTAGDAATATVNGKEIKFARITGRWFIRLE